MEIGAGWASSCTAIALTVDTSLERATASPAAASAATGIASSSLRAEEYARRAPRQGLRRMPALTRPRMAVRASRKLVARAQGVSDDEQSDEPSPKKSEEKSVEAWFGFRGHKTAERLRVLGRFRFVHLSAREGGLVRAAWLAGLARIGVWRGSARRRRRACRGFRGIVVGRIAARGEQHEEHREEAHGAFVRHA